MSFLISGRWRFFSDQGSFSPVLQPAGGFYKIEEALGQLANTAKNMRALYASKGMNIIIEELSIVTLNVSDRLGPYVIGYGGQLMKQVGGKLVPVIEEGIEVFVHVVH